MLAATTGHMSREHSGTYREILIGGSVTSSRRWPRLAWMAASLLLTLGAGQLSRAQTVTFTIIHNFNGTDGATPTASLVWDASGNLYGTTAAGGSANYGTVFKIDAAGNETVLHNFTGGTDGANPFAGLVRDASGNLYGTTGNGGSAGLGTVFKIDAAGNESVLHNFNGTDGADPEGGLVRDASGALYGTTAYGGDPGCYFGCGTVFKIDSSGNFTILHNFMGGSDGISPLAELILDPSGNLYGTTEVGGGGSPALGTVFKIDSSGTETVLHSFTSGADGADLYAPVYLDGSGNLYGTTANGGAPTGMGTVFKIDPSGNESILHVFTDGRTDGEAPHSGLIMDSSGNLYGTTYLGGSAFRGIVFKIDPSGNFTVVHNFTGGTTDGANPSAGLILDSSGNLYGTTTAGGSSDLGTVFKIAFSFPFSSFSAKLDTTAGPPPGFQLQAFFTQGTGAPAIDPVTQGMTLTVGTYTVTIPPSAFHQVKKGWWVYEGTIGGVALEVRISQRGTNPYELQAEASGVDLTSLTNPVAVTLVLGSNTGTTEVNQ